MRVIGIELYFDDVERAAACYTRLGLTLAEEETGHYSKFAAGDAFICLERKGSESYPSQDKAVVFLEVADVKAVIDRLGSDQVVELGPVAAEGALRGQCSTILRGTTYFSLLAARSQALLAQLFRTVVQLAAGESGFSSGRGSRADSCR